METRVADTRAKVRVDWTPTRAAGLARLAAFLPHAGQGYARERNSDRGPDDRSNVSALSPWLRRRILTEEEVLRAVLREHGPAAAAKFIDEVFWRSYWKGWLQQRPAQWQRYRDEAVAARTIARRIPMYERACDGRTGIDAFDAWHAELVQQGWLHNHARMWFASIWIFTLRLPWTLGAQLFEQHLLDADPASNTLSWRWVAGLHTRGKHYLARAHNIRIHTLGRFDPEGQLDEQAATLEEAMEPAPRVPLPTSATRSESRCALLLHADDLHPESAGFDADVVGIAALAAEDDEARQALLAARFEGGALDDALSRAGAHFSAPVHGVADVDGLVAWALALGVRDIATCFAPVGPHASRLQEFEQALAPHGIRLVRKLRDWDARCWPHAGAGFFGMRARIPAILRERSLLPP